jgi:hypothetical protein
MSREVYYEHSRAGCTRSNVFLDAKGCLNDVFGQGLGHGKSPCFSRCRVSIVFSVDGGRYFLGGADGGFFHE